MLYDCHLDLDVINFALYLERVAPEYVYVNILTGPGGKDGPETRA
jgi:hypothetical protein